MDRPGPDEQARVEAVRAQLPAVEASIYLNTASAGPIPRPADEAMRELSDYELRFGRANPAGWDELAERLGECRGAVAAALRSDLGAVALTHSTTDGLNVAVSAIDWRPGDEVVTTTLEHTGLLAPLSALVERGVAVRHADVGDGGDDEETVGAIERELSPRTRLVALSHVSWLNGALLPVERAARLAREAGAWTVVDGAQSVGAFEIEVPALGADFYAVPAQKWLLGPEGMGALWASPRAIEEALQARASWWSTDAATGHARDASIRPWPDARRFDATGFHAPSVTAFARSVGWFAMHVGFGWAAERSGRLTDAVATALAAIPGVTVLTPRSAMARIVTFRVARWPADDAADALSRRIFATVRPIEPLDALRASIEWFNTEAELERFHDAVEDLARHTPETYPRRAELTILGE